MKIAILGSDGFVGRNLADHLQQHYDVTPVTRQSLNLLDYHAVATFLSETYYDVIVCAAASMNNNLDDVKNNLGLFMNFYSLSDLFGKFINTASGAEYDRSRNIHKAKENEIWSRYPQDSYGLSQNMRSRLSWDKDNFYNLRIFNCFGSGEIKTRLFPSLLAEQTYNFTVTNDRYFDYFSIQDLCKVVEYYANTVIPENFKDINCVYENKYKISEVAEKFSRLHKLNKQILVEGTSQNNYTGDGTKLASLPIKLSGLLQGLDNYR